MLTGSIKKKSQKIMVDFSLWTNVIKLMNGIYSEKCEDNFTPNYRITVQLYAKIP